MRKLWLNLKMQFRVPISLFFSLGFPILMMTVMMISFGNFSIGDGYKFIDKYFLISTSIGLIPLAFISFPIDIGEKLTNGTLTRLKYFSVNVKGLLVADILSYLIMSIISISLNIIVATIFWQLKIPSLQYFISFIIQLIFGVVGLLLIGAIIALLLKNPKILMPFGIIILFITYMFIGVFIQYSQLPSALTKISEYMPIKYITNDFYNIWSQKELFNHHFLFLNTLLVIIGGVILIIINYIQQQRGHYAKKART